MSASPVEGVTGPRPPPPAAPPPPGQVEDDGDATERQPQMDKQEGQHQHRHRQQQPQKQKQQPDSHHPPPTGSLSAADDSDTDYRRLGRERPAALPSRPVELAFVATVVLSMMLSEYFIGGFNIVLPPLADALAIPPAARTWPAGVTNLTTAALLQPFARLCDLYGARAVFLAGHAWMAAWSLAAGFSASPTLLVFAVYGAFACIGFYVGILMGAVASELLSWPWYFWIGALLGLTVALAGLVTIPRRLAAPVDAAVRMDWWGVCTLVPALVLVVFALTDAGHAPRGWRTPYIYLSLALGLVLLAAAVFVQGWVAAQPLLPPDMFRHRYIKRLMGSLFCSYGVFGLFLFYTSFYIQDVMHKPPLLAAAWFTPLAVGGIFLAIGGGLVLHLVSNRALVIVSCLGFLLSSLLFALIPEQAAGGPSTGFLYWAYVFPAMLAGTIGIDITFNVTNVFITTAMGRRHQAAASGLINSLLYLGIAFWLGVAEAAVSAAVPGRDARVALSVVSLALAASVRMGQAEGAMTADEKAELEREAARDAPAPAA